MGSMYSKYLREKTDDEIIESEYGYATYRILNEGKSVYIVDLYIEQEFRKKGIASQMADLIVEAAKKNGAKELLGTVIPSAKGSTDSLRVLLGYGMILFAANNDQIVFRKDI